MCNYYFPRTLVGIFQALCSQPKFAPVSLGREMLATSREQSSRGCQQSIGALTIASLAAAQAEALFCL